MRGASGSLLIIVGIIALWIALTGKLDLFAEFWSKLTANTTDTAASTTGSKNGLDNQSLEDAIKALPNPPKIPASILHDPIFR